MRQFDLDLSTAVISSDSNPFVSSSTSSPTGTGTGSGSAATSGSSSGGNTGASAGNSGVTVVGNTFKVITNYQTAHGVIMGATMVLLLPLGAMFMRLGASIYLHGAWQLFALCAMLCGFGLGIKLAQMRSLVGFLFQFPFGGSGGGDFAFSPGSRLGFPYPRSLVEFERRSEIGRASIAPCTLSISYYSP
jgi:hypothetical protein